MAKILTFLEPPNKKPKNFLNFFVEPIKSIVKPKNPYLDFLVEGCKIPNSIFDEAGDCKGNWSLRNKTGPPRYLKEIIYLLLTG